MTYSVNENSGLEVGVEAVDDEVTLLDVLQTILENLRLLVLGPLAVGAIALCVSFLIPPTYTAKTQFLPPHQQQIAAASVFSSLGSLGGLAGAVSGIKNPADQFLAYIKSVTLQDALVERFNLQERYDTDTKVETRKELSKNVRAASGKDGLISIEVDDEDPHFAAQLANAHIEELAKLLSRLAISEAQQRRLFFEKQLIQSNEKLIKSEIALKATGVSGSVLKTNLASATATVAGLQAAVTAQEVKLGAMRSYYSETAPDFMQAKNELANLRAQLAKQGKDTPSVGSNAETEGDYITKYREFKYHETLFELFSKQFELAKLDEAREGALIQVLDEGKAPERKSKPKRATIAMIAFLAAGFALLLFVFLRQVFVIAEKDKNSAQKLIQIKKTLRKALGFT